MGAWRLHNYARSKVGACLSVCACVCACAHAWVSKMLNRCSRCCVEGRLRTCTASSSVAPWTYGVTSIRDTTPEVTEICSRNATVNIALKRGRVFGCRCMYNRRTSTAPQAAGRQHHAEMERPQPGMLQQWPHRPHMHPRSSPCHRLWGIPPQTPSLEGGAGAPALPDSHPPRRRGPQLQVHPRQAPLNIHSI
jgi:hypothetical protein